MRRALVALALAGCTRGTATTTDAGGASGAGALASGSAPPVASSSAPDASAPAPEVHDVEGMRLVPAGAFTMGADAGGEADERPAHTVTLPAFYLDVNLVANEAYERCVEAKVCGPIDPTSAARNRLGSDARFRGAKQPASAMSWDDARAYCAWVGKRLPREAELEKAARGTDARRYPWGNDPPTPERAVFGGRGATEDVGTHPAGDGPYGHHDLAGNVWEWTEDVYDPYAYTRPGAPRGEGGTCEEALAALADLRSKGARGFTGSNPIPNACERVLRGGAFNYDGDGLRATNRVHHPARYHLVMAGFRCAKDGSVAP